MLLNCILAEDFIKTSRRGGYFFYKKISRTKPYFGADEMFTEKKDIPIPRIYWFQREKDDKKQPPWGLEDHIVGYAWQDNEVLPQYKEAFEKIEPLCEPAMDPGEEKVLSVNPDLVLSWASWDDSEYFNYKNLEKNGIQTYGFHCERWSGGRLEDVYTDFVNIGKIFHVEDKAEALVSELKTNIEATEKKVADKEPVSVFVCDASSNEEACMTVAGGLPQDLVEKAGGKNVVTDGDSNWVRGYSWENIIAADPEWIVVDYYASADEADAVLDLLQNDPQLSQMKAVKEGNIMTVGLTELSCSERIDDCVANMAAAFHGVE